MDIRIGSWVSSRNNVQFIAPRITFRSFLAADWGDGLRGEDSAEITLLLVSPAFLASPQVMAQLQFVMKRRSSGETRVLPVLFVACDWREDTSFGG